MKNIVTKGWNELCKPPKPTTILVVMEFHANLVDQGLERVWVRGKWVPFDNDNINAFYNLPEVDNEAYENLRKEPNYFEIIELLTNNQEKWKINHEGQVVNFKANYGVFSTSLRCDITSLPQGSFPPPMCVK